MSRATSLTGRCSACRRCWGRPRRRLYWDHNGLEAGFRIVDIEPDSVFDKLGLLQEDVIVSVNGVSVRNNQEALAAYQSFKSADALQLGLLREGREVTIDFFHPITGIQHDFSFSGDFPFALLPVPVFPPARLSRRWRYAGHQF